MKGQGGISGARSRGGTSGYLFLGSAVPLPVNVNRVRGPERQIPPGKRQRGRPRCAETGSRLGERQLLGIAASEQSRLRTLGTSQGCEQKRNNCLKFSQSCSEETGRESSAVGDRRFLHLQNRSEYWPVELI
uniref:Uncharacterized protein n=1 Tax=Molossus molossus TaxID=27622 RepID=A0A7J8C8I6_MOLMO|nr:hypothetical protein HJG59_009845 [Molossus molossus]